MRRWLFVKRDLRWPRSRGNDLHSYHLMRALERTGDTVAFLSLRPSDPQAVDGLDVLEVPAVDGVMPRLSVLQRRAVSYWCLEESDLARVNAAVRAYRPDATVAVGLDVLSTLLAVPRGQRVWYAADESARQHLSQCRLDQPATWDHVRQAVVNGATERLFAGACDVAWVVAERDRQALRLVAEPPQVDVIANGVDTAHFRPQAVTPTPFSCVFWGRLDFGPNQQALEWFLTQVWPRVQAEVPSATCGVYGFHPPARVQALTARAGVTLTADSPDLRAAVSGHAVAVLPFVSGGGVKNKLLEAAALGLPIIASPTAFGGLRGKTIPIIRATTSAEWATALVRLWRDNAERSRLGSAARAWVCDWHSWERSAAEARRTLTARLQVA